jgi:hypothetical protein
MLNSFQPNSSLDHYHSLTYIALVSPSIYLPSPIQTILPKNNSDHVTPLSHLGWSPKFLWYPQQPPPPGPYLLLHSQFILLFSSRSEHQPYWTSQISGIPIVRDIPGLMLSQQRSKMRKGHLYSLKEECNGGKCCIAKLTLISYFCLFL